MAHALRAGAEARDVARRAERLVGDLSAMEGFQPVAGGILEADQATDMELRRFGAAGQLHAGTCCLQPGGERIERGGIGHFPAEDLAAGGQ